MEEISVTMSHIEAADYILEEDNKTVRNESVDISLSEGGMESKDI